MRIVILSFCLCAAACTLAPEYEGESTEVPVETFRLPASAHLQGSWRVAGLDGQSIDAPYAIALVADEENIWWEPECALQYRTYDISGDHFTAFGRSNTNLEVCDIGYPEELPQIWSALEAADHIGRTPENGVMISGNGRSVTLFSQ